jgi:hypothetical protein
LFETPFTTGSHEFGAQGELVNSEK